MKEAIEAVTSSRSLSEIAPFIAALDDLRLEDALRNALDRTSALDVATGPINRQIDRIEKEATARGADVTIVVDFIHVLEYLWGAVWCFFPEGDTALRLGCMIEHWPCWKATLGRWPLASGDGQRQWD